MSNQCTYVLTRIAVIGQISEHQAITPPATSTQNTIKNGNVYLGMSDHTMLITKALLQLAVGQTPLQVCDSSILACSCVEDRQAPGLLAHQSTKVLEQHGSQC